MLCQKFLNEELVRSEPCLTVSTVSALPPCTDCTVPSSKQADIAKCHIHPSPGIATHLLEIAFTSAACCSKPSRKRPNSCFNNVSLYSCHTYYSKIIKSLCPPLMNSMILLQKRLRQHLPVYFQVIMVMSLLDNLMPAHTFKSALVLKSLCTFAWLCNSSTNPSKRCHLSQPKSPLTLQSPFIFTIEKCSYAHYLITFSITKLSKNNKLLFFLS